MSEEASYALELAEMIERAGFGADTDGVHFAPTDAALAAKALRALAAIRDETARNNDYPSHAP